MDETVVMPAEKKHYGGFLRKNLREYAMFLSLLAIMLFFQVKTEGTLMMPLNLTNLLLQNSYIVIMALAMLLVIVAGHIDLSVGSVAGFIGALAAVLMVQYQLPVALAAVLCLLVGALIGAAQGYFVAYHRIPAFIVTLAGMLVFRGLTLTLLDGQSIGPFPEFFQKLSSGFIPEFIEPQGLRLTSLLIGAAVALSLLARGIRHRQAHLRHGMEDEPAPFFWLKMLAITVFILFFSYKLCDYKGLPNVLIIMGALVAVYHFVTNHTTLGRRVYALGGNEKATRLSGIDTRRLAFYTFVNMGVLAALGGLVFAARLNTATPKAGLGFELDVIAACFIGGASASGGVGKVMGAVIGAFIMGVMNNGMSLLGIGIDYQQVIKGLVLLGAVWVDVYYKNK
ncbi:multiple monosaccharide ABC transporter permease [Paludibacterium purpuratum]|uniref:Xylose transport system permease protein XylH n=1 Tax=Paludibacterium purpuratum TaxID=1144873 RepID=A0A4R7B8I6_9NEIS|nr:multiple monosaccharide ABC transporter permease [Paludibacterium purpuratum]TDR80046.1 multiple monosaccharide ABC transporter membrane protein [Paludibacterium purpuratum]